MPPSSATQRTFQTQSWPLSQQEAASSLLKRRQARAGLIAFTEVTNPRYETAPFHRLVAGKLEAVERGEIDRLMLMLPPRHGKSELASRRFPAYALGRQPERQFIAVSATAELAADFGRDVRNAIVSREYRSLFDATLAEDSQARNKWHTSQGGIFYAIGIGGSVLGRGSDVMLIDDPFASMADAQSEMGRRRVWDWYTGSAYNRLMPGGSIVIIGHRMHEDDLQGRLLAQQAAGGDKWDVVEIPAFAYGSDILGRQEGDALWPERYPAPALERIRRNTLPRYWSALYQQHPTPDVGDYFKVDWLKPYTVAPNRATLQVYGASDYAVTSNGGDYTVHVVVGVDPDDKLWLLDLWRGQSTPDVWIDALCDMVTKWKPLDWAEETGQIKSSVGPFLEKRLLERKAYVSRTVFPTRGDKSVRAQSIRGRMAMQGLYIPASAPWRADLTAELLSFPAGMHDDIADSLGLLGQLLDKMVSGHVPKPEKRKLDDGYEPVKTEPTDDWFSTL